MSDSAGYDDDDLDGSEALAGPPLWVKVVAAVIAVVLLIVTVLVLTGGPEAHGPRRHGMGGDGPATHTLLTRW